VASEVLRRLSGEKTETSAVFNMTTSSDGKTHSLTVLYHLAKNGPKAKEWLGVSHLLQAAKLNAVRQQRWPCSLAPSLTLSRAAVAPTARQIGRPMGRDRVSAWCREGPRGVSRARRTGVAPGGDVSRALACATQFAATTNSNKRFLRRWTAFVRVCWSFPETESCHHVGG
jgi:hypothetical protein